MKNVNGLLIFENDENLPTIKGVEIPKSTEKSKFGFKIKASEGKLIWEAADEVDYREAEAIRLGIKKDDIKIDDQMCHADSPYSCTGPCYYGGFCKPVYRLETLYIYCACV